MDFGDRIIEAEKTHCHIHKKPRYLIYRRTAGLGDLLMGLYSAWRYASTYNRILIVDWRWSLFLKDNRNLFSFLFHNCNISGVEIRGDDEIANIVYPEPIYPSIFTPSFLRDSKYHPYDYAPYEGIEPADKQARRILYETHVSNPTYVIGEQLCIVPHFIMVEALRQDIIFFFMMLFSHLNPDLKNKILSARKILFGDKNPVGIHLRYGNGNPVFLFDHGRSNPQTNTERDLRALSSSLKDQDVYFCTDSQQIQELAETIFPHLISYKRWYSPIGTEPHFAMGDSGEDLVHITEDIFTEMILLSFCTKIFSLWGRSCFSLMPSLINHFPHYKIFNPYY